MTDRAESMERELRSLAAEALRRDRPHEWGEHQGAAVARAVLAILDRYAQPEPPQERCGGSGFLFDHQTQTGECCCGCPDCQEART